LNKDHYISTYCIIRNQQIIRDGQVLYADEEGDFPTFIKAAYKHLHMDYPKFYKMDNLSKLGLIAAEVLLNQEEDKSDIALVLANRSGSLDTDVRHQESIQQTENYFPSPAIFVYTLANICAGEISIRHGLQSENAFFVSDEWDGDTMVSYASYLLQSGKAKQVLCGWLELFSDKYQAVLYLVGQKGTLPHQAEQIEQLFLK